MSESSRWGTIEGFVPSYNNAESIARAIVSLQRQSVPLARIVVVDDGSCDASPRIARQHRAEVLVMKHLGRGAVRAMGISRCRGEFQLCCDATMELEPDFLEKVLPWLEKPMVAAVFGGIRSARRGNAVDRWRGRHLFNEDLVQRTRNRASLSTWGCLLRVSAIKSVGNFNPTMEAYEDRELGKRLLGRGFDVIYEPGAMVKPLLKNSLHKVFERYCRWNGSIDRPLPFQDYLKFLWYVIRVQVPRDIREYDMLGAFISVMLPQFQFLYSRRKRR